MDRRAQRFVGAVLATATLGGLLAVTALTRAAVTPAPSPSVGMTAPAVGALNLGESRYPVPAGAKFVSLSGSDSNVGSQSSPWRTLGHASARSAAGTTVVMRGGTYRESVQVYGKKLVIQPYPGERVWLSGSDVVTGWTVDGDDWRRDNWTPSFPRSSDSFLLDPAYPLAAWPEMAFLDGSALRQVRSRSEVTRGTFFVDDGRDQVFIGNDPAGRTIELTARPWGLYFNRADDSVLRGIGVRHYATPLSQLAAVRAYSNRVLIEQVHMEDNALAALSVIGTGTTVRRSTFRRNGQLGIHGNNADGLAVDASLLERNNVEHYNPVQTGGGLKVTRSRHLRLRGNQVYDNIGKGLWTDISSLDVEVTSNVVRNSTRHGIHIELTGKALVANNVVTGCGDRGIVIMESNDVEVWNNTLLDNVRNLDVIDGVRTSSDLSSDNHDRRFPIPNPEILWDIQRVRIRNNVMGGNATSTQPLFRVEDATHTRTGAQMGVTSDYNAFFRRSATTPGWTTLWANWPVGAFLGTTLSIHKQLTGQDAHSVAADGGRNPWVTDAVANDFRVPLDAPGRIGTALPVKVAYALGGAVTGPVHIGVLSTTIPNTPPVAAITSSCDDGVCRFSGRGARDLDGSVTAWRWVLPNGSTATGPEVTTTLPGTGTYQVRLTVADDSTNEATVTSTVSGTDSDPLVTTTTQAPATTTTTAGPTSTTTSTTSTTTTPPVPTTTPLVTTTVAPIEDAPLSVEEAQITRLYLAFFLRAPDAEGLRYWLRRYRDGTPLASISEEFAGSREFRRLYGTVDDEGFVTLAYTNVFGRAADPGGFRKWTRLLREGAITRGGVMLAFSESDEFVALTGTTPPR